MKVMNLITTGVASVCAFMAGCGIGTNKNAKEFKWHATDSAPKHYPMEIRQGDFIYHDKSGSLYIPTGATLRSGWGEMVSDHVTGPAKKPLPDALDIYFFPMRKISFTTVSLICLTIRYSHFFVQVLKSGLSVPFIMA